MPGKVRTRSSRTSPTLEPEAVTDDWPLACWRRTVGSRTSTDTGPSREMLTSSLEILTAFEDNRLFVDLPVHDPVRAQGGAVVPQGDDHVVPGGVGGLSDV